MDLDKVGCRLVNRQLARENDRILRGIRPRHFPLALIGGEDSVEEPRVDEEKPVYARVEDYDPVLRAHCRIERDGVRIPALGTRRPVSVV